MKEKRVRILIPLIIIYSFTSIGCAASQQNMATARQDNVKVILTNSETPLSDDIPSSPSPQVEQHQKKVREQSSFGAEEEIEDPISVPADVLRILRRDERNQTCLNEGQPEDAISASWFVASEIDIDGNESADLVVKASNPCLFGANIDPFWIFRNTPRGYEHVLSVSTLGLDVLNAKTNGYRDVRTTAATANEVIITIYKFDGRKYKAARSWREPI